MRSVAWLALLAVTAPALAVPAQAAPQLTSRYSRLDRCTVLERNKDEGGWSVQRCPGLAGYRLRRTEGDLRENLIVELPGGGEANLKLGEVTGKGGFSSLGDTAEWRGRGRGGAFRPESLIVRFVVVEDAERPERPTSYLLVVALGRRPCVIGIVPPGANQNARSRRLADAAGPCLAA
jgi:hypothetical protein